MELTHGQTPFKVSIKAEKGLINLNLGAIWRYRELLYFLVWRDLKVRYKQTAIGAAWAIIHPVMAMLIFTIIFGRFARIPSDGVPYPVFAFTALLPWGYFSEALRRSQASLVGDAQLISKVYFPRLIIPLATVLTPLVDFGLSFIILLGLMCWYGITPGPAVLMLPLFLLQSLLVALSIGLWLGPLNVRFRDVGHIVPVMLQLWMYASPVVYPVSMIPERWRFLYSLNPMTGVIEGFRWALLGKESPDFRVVAGSMVMVLILLVGGAIFFRQMERTFADVI